MQGGIYRTVQKRSLKTRSPASRIRRIGPLKYGFAGPTLRFGQELVPFHNPLPIRFSDPVWRTHDSLEFYANRAPLEKASCPNLKTKPDSDQFGTCLIKQKTPRPKSEGFLETIYLTRSYESVALPVAQQNPTPSMQC